MKKEIGSLAAAAVLAALCAMPTQASTRITTVTNTWNATNGCTVRSVYGYGGYNFNVTIWGVDCPSDPEVYVEKHETWYDWGGLWCEMKNASSGYYVTSNCSSYSIYRN